jgi:hypothetical protein
LLAPWLLGKNIVALGAYAREAERFFTWMDQKQRANKKGLPPVTYFLQLSSTT